MRFYVDVSQNMSDSILQKNHDRSFCSIIRSGDKWDFQILIDPFPVLILNINTKSNQCVSTEGIYHCSGKIIYSRLNIQQAIPGRLYIADAKFDPYCFGTQYTMQNAKMIRHKEYFDDAQDLYGFGDINADFPIYEYAHGQFVKLDKNGQLVAIYVKFAGSKLILG